MLCPWITGTSLRSYSNLPSTATCWQALDPTARYPVVWYDLTQERGQVFIPGHQWSIVINLPSYIYFSLPQSWYDCGDEDY